MPHRDLVHFVDLWMPGGHVTNHQQEVVVNLVLWVLLWVRSWKRRANSHQSCLEGVNPVCHRRLSPKSVSQASSKTTGFRAQGPGDGQDSRSLIPSHIPSCSALRRPVMRFVFPHRMKSASLSWPMNACLQASAEGGSRSFSVGGDARWRISFNGATCMLIPDPEAGAPGRIEADMIWLS